MSKFRLFTLLLLLTGFVAHPQLGKPLNLLPVPKNLQQQKGSLIIRSDFTVSVQTNGPDTILIKAVNRMYQTLNRWTGLYFSRESIGFKDDSDSSILLVHVKKIVLPAIGTDESYSLNVTNSHIILDAPTTAGALHGLQTLLQLCTKNGNEFSFPSITINDEPRFQWRGLMIDVSRHFIPIDVLERNIEAMAAVKMNVLHLHLTDDQGFRIESKAYPLLHRKGSNGEYYSQAQIRDLISFAQDRGIVIVPEFDIPGHSKSWFAGYPQLASTPGRYEPGPPVNFDKIKGNGIGAIMQFMNTAPFPSMDPSKENTYTFLDKFLTEMAALFPSPYIHIGADENNGVAWKNNPDIVAFMQKKKIATVHELQAYFVKRVQQIIKKKNKQMIGWEELFSKELPKDVIVQVWQNSAYLKKALENGNPTLLSKGFYLDIFMPAYIHYANPDLPSILASSSENLLKGGEAAQWTEMADKNNIETRIWPRAAAIAERLWSPSTVNDVDDMYRRLFIISKQLDQQGLLHIVNYERSLRLYTNDEDYSALKTLTDVLTPIKGYKKLLARVSMPAARLYQTAPLIEASDFLFVDSEVEWKFRAAVRSYLQNKDVLSEKIIDNYLTLWQNNHKTLENLFATTKQLEQIKEHSRNLSIVAAIGKTALDKIKAGTAPLNEWINECMESLKNASRPYGESELAIVSEIEALIKQQIISLPPTYPSF